MNAVTSLGKHPNNRTHRVKKMHENGWDSHAVVTRAAQRNASALKISQCMFSGSIAGRNQHDSLH